METAQALYPYQEDGVAFLLSKTSVLLADEMGLGKTVQVAVAAHRLFELGVIKRALFLCPASLCRNWRQELRRWCPRYPVVIYQGADRFGLLRGRASILVSTFDTVAADLRLETLKGDRFVDLDLDLVVIDEAQRIKDPRGIRSRVLGRILSPRRWAVSGTPMENRPSELGSVLRFLFPNEFADEAGLNDLQKIIKLRSSCMIRRRKSEVGLQLPQKTVGYIHVGMSPEQAAEYSQVVEALKRRLASEPLEGLRGSLLATLQHLRRISVISSSGSSSKLDFLEEAVEKAVSSGEKVVVFSSFAGLVLPEAQRRLSRFGAALFTGAMTQDERTEVHRRFIDNPECQVICAGLQAAGVGLTWTVASHVFVLDLWWNPQVIQQAEDRVHRIGQTSPVFVSRLVSEATIEEGIQRLAATKSEIFDLLVNDDMAHLNRMTLPDLLQLVGTATN